MTLNRLLWEEARHWARWENLQGGGVEIILKNTMFVCREIMELLCYRGLEEAAIRSCGKLSLFFGISSEFFSLLSTSNDFCAQAAHNRWKIRSTLNARRMQGLTDIYQ